MKKFLKIIFVFAICFLVVSTPKEVKASSFMGYSFPNTVELKSSDENYKVYLTDIKLNFGKIYFEGYLGMAPANRNIPAAIASFTIENQKIKMESNQEFFNTSILVMVRNGSAELSGRIITEDRNGNVVDERAVEGITVGVEMRSKYRFIK